MAESVVLNRVGKAYGAAPAVLDRIQFQVEAGEVVALLGPSGCGKSTLLRLIAGLDQPTSGSVALGAQVVTNCDPRCAVVFQEPRLLPWRTVAGNVALGAHRRAPTSTPEALLESVGLAGFERYYPHQLSGGMAQRVALARALIGVPEVVLLDEPLAALDAFTRMQMQDVIANVQAQHGATVVLVTHDVDEALYLADRVVILSGRPATVAAVVPVPLPRPRDRGDALLADLRAQILAHFGFAHARSTKAA